MRHSLSQPTEHYGGLPPCPYAQPAFERGEVSVILTERLGRILTLKNKLPPQGDQTYVIAWTRPHRMSPAQLDRWIERHNEKHAGVWLMGFHPDAEEQEGIPEVPIDIQSDYAVILMQRLETVVRASAALARTQYYEGYADAEWQSIAWRDECARDPALWESLEARRAVDLPGQQ